MDLRRLRLAAYSVFAAQLGVWLWWSHRIWSRFSLTGDYSQYWQAWWQLNHGAVNPYDSIAQHSFWHDHAVFLMLPLAWITHFGLGGYGPMVVQDLLVTAAEIIAFRWILDLLAERDLGLPLRNWVVGAACLLFMVANPWTFWGLSFDVHFDVSAALPFFVLAMRALYERRYWRLAVWATICALGGDLAVTFLAALGLAGLVTSIVPSQRRIRASFALMVGGVAGFLAISHFGGNYGSLQVVASIAGQADDAASTHSTLLGNLSSVALHPWNLLTAPLHHLRNVWALVSPAGLVGLLSPWGFVIAGAVAVENTASGGYFSNVGFQYVPIYTPLAVTTIFAIRTLNRSRWAGRLIAGLLVLSVLNTIGWAVVWLPRANAQWVRVNAAASRVLTKAQDIIPDDAQVVASQGVVGRFSARDQVYAYPNNLGALVPINRPAVYFVLVPYQGIEIVSPDKTLGLITRLAGPMHATLVLHGSGVWVFRWTPPSPHTKYVSVQESPLDSPVAAWSLHSAVGRPLLTGPSHSWAMASNSRAGGYLTYGAYFNRDPGHYKLRIRMSTTGTANVEAWNSSDNTLMSRRTVPETNGIVSVTMPVDNTGLHPTPVQRGTFLFKQDPVAAIPGQVIEARVYLPAGEYGVVYSVQLIEDKR